jgi:acyl carrier protein
MNEIYASVLAVFPAFKRELSPKTRLAEIDGWDSMNAINLQMELEQQSGIAELNLKLTDQTTLAEIASQVAKQRTPPPSNASSGA